MIRLLLFSLFLSTAGFAQTDSVIVMGRIQHLTPQLYRQSPQVTISRNNILQASRELVRPALLAPDGSFRVSVPLIYPYEELYFNFNNITTAFLASSGTITIDLNADSLFSIAVPFRFKGTNAAVNQQYARYKAFEANYPDKPDGKKLSRQASSKTDAALHSLLMETYTAPIQAFSKQEKVLPLLNTWLTNIARYNAATFQYDKALAEAGKVDVVLNDSLRPKNDILLTAARATAYNRFADYAIQQANPDNARSGGVPVARLADLLTEYTPRLTVTERNRLEEIKENKTAKPADLRFFEQLMRRRPDTLGRLINYETLIYRSSSHVDSVSLEYLTAYWLAQSLPVMTIDFANLTYQFAKPKVKQPYLRASMTELYSLQVNDSTRIRKVLARFAKNPISSALEVGTGTYITVNKSTSGESLLNSIVNRNRGKMIYLLLWDPSDEMGRQAAIEAQRISDMLGGRVVDLVYLCVVDDSNDQFVSEFIARYQLRGDHLLFSMDQLGDVLPQLQLIESTGAVLISPTGKILKRNIALPDQPDEILKLLQRYRN